MAFLLNILLVAILAVVFGVAAIGFIVHQSIRGIRRRFRDAVSGGRAGASPQGQDRGKGEGTPRRGPKRKIFAEGEGEYVDFEEEG